MIGGEKMSREHKAIVRPEKAMVVSELTEKFKKATIVLLSDYQGTPGTDGLTVKEIKELRRKLQEASAELKVAKNTLAKKAMQEAGKFDLLFPYLERATSFTIGYDDPVSTTKALIEFAKAHKTPKNETGLPVIKAGYLDGQLLKVKDLQALAALPSKEVLLAMIMGSIQAPFTNFVRTARAPLQNFMNIMSQLEKQRSATA